MISTVYEPMAELFGLVPKEHYGDHAWEYFAVAAASLAEGLAPRYFLGTRRLVEGVLRPDPVGGTQEWSLFAIVFEKLIEEFFEPPTFPSPEL